jgi:hypothetical protein
MKTNELKPCPCCKEDPVRVPWEHLCGCVNEDCILWDRHFAIEEWNIRPIEDELMEKWLELRDHHLFEVEHLNKAIEQLKKENEELMGRISDLEIELEEAQLDAYEPQ